MKNLLTLLLFITIITTAQTPPSEKLPIIIDADTANEIDDLYAIVRAIQAPELDLKAITSAQFHTSIAATNTSVLESQLLNEDIIRLMQRQEIPLPLGSNIPLPNDRLPAISEASNFIVEEALQHTPDNPLHLVILGSCTNVASAILQDSTIIPNVQVYYIGFWHDSKTNTYDKKEFNSGNDTLAVNVLLNTKGLDFNVMTATTCQHLVFDKSDVDVHLKGKVGIADYLVNRWETYDRWWTKDDPEKLKWIMWDLAIIEALIHPEWAVKKEFMTPPENTKRTIQAYTSIEKEKMIADFWKSLEGL